MRKSPLDKRKAAALMVALLLAAALGIWLFASPMLEKQKMAHMQEKLVECITQGDGIITLETPIANTAVDFYEPTVEPSEAEHIMWTEIDEPEAPEDTGAPIVITGLGILTIDKIDLHMPVADGATATNLKVSAGWVRETAPIGSVGNAVIAGHRNFDYGSHFNRLGEIEVGDEIVYLCKDGESMHFRVFEILEVLPGDGEAFVQPEDKTMLTLLTCTPTRTATHRLLVRAELTVQEGVIQ